MTGVLALRPNHDDFRLEFPLLDVVVMDVDVRWCRRFGLSVKTGRYSMVNSSWSFSLSGEVGTPSWTRAESPLKSSPKRRFFCCDGGFSGVEELEEEGFRRGMEAAHDLARECSTLPERERAAAAGGAVDSEDRRREPKPSRGGAGESGGCSWRETFSKE
jgi:hypothetical protein